MLRLQQLLSLSCCGWLRRSAFSGTPRPWRLPPQLAEQLDRTGPSKFPAADKGWGHQGWNRCPQASCRKGRCEISEAGRHSRIRRLGWNGRRPAPGRSASCSRPQPSRFSCSSHLRSTRRSNPSDQWRFGPRGRRAGWFFDGKAPGLTLSQRGLVGSRRSGLLAAVAPSVAMGTSHRAQATQEGRSDRPVFGTPRRCSSLAERHCPGRRPAARRTPAPPGAWLRMDQLGLQLHGG